MKLKDGFVIQEMAGETVMVATGEASKEFRGIVRNNKTAAYIANLLLQDTTREEIIINICLHDIYKLSAFYPIHREE